MSLSNYPTNSLIIPVYRCAEELKDSLHRALSHLRRSRFSWELIVVDDGSGDNTPDVAQQLLQGIPGTRVIRLSRNLGKGGAVIRGLQAARGKFRVFTDCDLAYPLEQLERIVDALASGADVAIVDRRHPESTCELPTHLLMRAHLREAIGRSINRLLQELGLTSFRDTQAGLKGFRESVIPLLDLATVYRFAFDIELLVIMAQNGCRVMSVPVHYQLQDAGSTVRPWKDGKDVLQSIAHIWGNARRGRYRPAWFTHRPQAAEPTSQSGWTGANSTFPQRKRA